MENLTWRSPFFMLLLSFINFRKSKTIFKLSLDSLFIKTAQLYIVLTVLYPQSRRLFRPFLKSCVSLVYYLLKAQIESEKVIFGQTKHTSLEAPPLLTSALIVHHKYLVQIGEFYW